MNEKLHNILTELREKLAAEYGDRLVNIILFGSQARGEATPESDIDVMVILRDAARPGVEMTVNSDLAVELSLKYDTFITLIFVSQARYLSGQSPLLINVRREGVAV
jgi:predicted nucleotidyltransferase